MQKTSTFFLIHNFNTIPENLLKYTQQYLIMDASDDPTFTQALADKKLHFRHVENTGHNLTSYFNYFAEEYDNLPEIICLCKGNMIGRHMSEEYFNRVYQNTWFTYLYEEKQYREKYAKYTDRGELAEEGIASLVSESQFIEKNTSWYVESVSHPHRFFTKLDDMIRFIYKDPVIPRYCLFSPGACYIVRREQIRKHSPAFYLNLCKLMNYGMNPSFPAEAHMVERLMPVIFEAAYEENEWMSNGKAYDKKLDERREVVQKIDAWDQKRLKRLRILLGQKPQI